MKRTQTILMTTVILSIALTSVFAIDFEDYSLNTNSKNLPFFYAEAGVPPYNPTLHTIEMEAVKMPDGMYAYRMISYMTENSTDTRNLVSEGLYSTKPSIPGPTLVFTETDTVNISLKNNACDDFVIGAAGENENSHVGIHVHGVHYDISDDATYGRVNMNSTSAAKCNETIDYVWEVSEGTEGTWPYHDHTFYQNEVGAEDLGLFGTVIVNPSDGVVDGIVKDDGTIGTVNVEDINKEFVLWMVSSEVLGRSVFYGMEIDNHHPETSGKQTALWINPPLYTEEGENVRFHVLGIGDETHAFHLHGHRWVEAQGGAADIIDVKEITPLQRHTFLVKASDNDIADTGESDTEGWMYHCHVFAHMQAGMSGMLMVVDDDTLPDVGAVFTLSDEPGLWMKTLNAGIGDDLDEVLESVGALSESDTKAGIGFPLNYLGKALGSGFADSQGRSLAVINPGETVLFNMKDSQTKHTITTLIYPTDAAPNATLGESPGGNGVVSSLGLGLFDTQLGIRGSSFVTDGNDEPLELWDPGLYVFVCKIHPYMFSAVIVDDPDTNVYSTALGAPLPLLDFSGNLTVLTRSGTLGSSQFPTTIPPTDPLALELLTDFFVITDPSNWKDYGKSHFTIDVPPVLVTTNTEDLVVGLNDTKANTLTVAGNLGIVKNDGFETPYMASEILGLELDKSIEIVELPPPEIPGIGEVWVNTQFERTVNKNHPGTPQDKPGTITVVDASDWKVKKKIALPEINMNHPHNMWTDTENEIIYQTQWFDSRMVAIDRDSGEMIKDNFVGQSPSHVMTSPSTGKIYVALNGEEQVAEFDPKTYEMTRQISTGPRSHPHGHWISSDGKYMVTPDFISLTSTIINLEDGTTSKPIGTHGNLFDGTPILLGPIATGMMGSAEKYYTADFLGNSLSVVDLDSKEIIKQIDLNGNGTGLPIQTPVSPDDKWVVTANVVAAKITVVDTSTDKVVAVLQCDPGCHGVQWGAKEGGGYYAYVSSKFSNALLVVDPDPNGDSNGEDAAVVGMIRLDDNDADIDDPVIGYDGMGGQGVLAIPNVYGGWIQETVDAVDHPMNCDTPKAKNAQGKGPCDAIEKYIDALTEEQKNPPTAD